MRHRKKGRTFGRKAAPRKALMRGLITNFLTYGKINTTVAKAKEVKPLIEKAITLGKENTLHTRRQLIEILYTEFAVDRVLTDIAPRYVDRAGGYIRIVKTGIRQGDGAPMARIELI